MEKKVSLEKQKADHGSENGKQLVLLLHETAKRQDQMQGKSTFAGSKTSTIGHL